MEDEPLDPDEVYDWSVVPEVVSGPPLEPLQPARRVTANGSVLAAIALGLRDVFDPERKRPEVVISIDEHHDSEALPQALELHFDPDDPSATRAVVRPWLDAR